MLESITYKMLISVTAIFKPVKRKREKLPGESDLTFYKHKPHRSSVLPSFYRLGNRRERKDQQQDKEQAIIKTSLPPCYQQVNRAMQDKGRGNGINTPLTARTCKLMNGNKREILLLQENDEAVSKHCHSHEEVGEGQPVSCFPDLPVPTIITVKQNRVLEVALQRAELVSTGSK